MQYTASRFSECAKWKGHSNDLHDAQDVLHLGYSYRRHDFASRGGDCHLTVGIGKSTLSLFCACMGRTLTASLWVCLHFWNAQVSRCSLGIGEIRVWSFRHVKEGIAQFQSGRRPYAHKLFGFGDECIDSYRFGPLGSLSSWRSRIKTLKGHCFHCLKF